MACGCPHDLSWRSCAFSPACRRSARSRSAPLPGRATSLMRSSSWGWRSSSRRFFIYLFARNDYAPPAYRPEIIYVEQWPLIRTDAQIRAAQIVDQKVKDKRLAAEKAARGRSAAPSSSKARRCADQVGHLTRPSRRDARRRSPLDGGGAGARRARTRGRTAPNPNVGCVIVARWPRRRARLDPGGRPTRMPRRWRWRRRAAKSRGATCLRDAGTLRASNRRAAPPVPTCWSQRASRGSSSRCAIPIRAPMARGWRGSQRRASPPRPTSARTRRGAVMAGFLTRRRAGRPQVTLKLATSLDGCIALADGSSRWITGAAARAHAHLERAGRSDPGRARDLAWRMRPRSTCGCRGWRIARRGASSCRRSRPARRRRALAGSTARRRSPTLPGRSPAGRRRRADRGGVPPRRAGRPVAAVSRADPDRGRQRGAGRYRAGRSGRGARALADRRCAAAWQRHGSRSTRRG